MIVYGVLYILLKFTIVGKKCNVSCMLYKFEWHHFILFKNIVTVRNLFLLLFYV